MHVLFSTRSRSITALLAGIWLATAAGCASFIPSSVTEVFEKEEPVVAPNSLAVVWTTTVLEKGTAPATRGFGGVVTFYGDDRSKPVRVHGELTIYAYDELKRKPDDSTPDRKYGFTREQLDKHYDDEGPIGPSYHIWIPWDEAGGPRREVSLILRFDPVEGKAVLGKPTHTVLVGLKDEKEWIWASRTSEPTAGAHAPATPDANRPSQTGTPRCQIRITTLDLPNRTTPWLAPSSGNPPSPDEPRHSEPRHSEPRPSEPPPSEPRP